MQTDGGQGLGQEDDYRIVMLEPDRGGICITL